MLIDTIAFEIRNFKTGEFEEFLVENTELNYAAIAQNHFTRQIRFGKTFDFQFARERKAPKFIEFAEAVSWAMIPMADDNFADVLIDPIDEMVGTF